MRWEEPENTESLFSADELAIWIARTRLIVERDGLAEDVLHDFRLGPAGRRMLRTVSGLSLTLSIKLASNHSSFTFAEVVSMMKALVDDLP